ncbi:hypothetical protein QTP88_017605 [Uroleucon formosanum]
MASSLSSLAENLVTPEHENFRETAKHFVAGDMPLVTRKGVYPYEYTNSWKRLEERRIPRKIEFYSTLTETGIKESDFEHAKEVWDHFGCTTLGEYSDLYLKIDVLLLADIFENFRDVCTRAYNLDAAHYFTAPGLSFDAMLKFTGQKLELLNDYDMLLMFENGNNLYGWAMSEYMPYGDFNWVESNLDGLSEMPPMSGRGRVYEVDISYPQHLHDQHSNLPLLPQNGIPPGSEVKKLMATFHQKRNYIVHRVLEFSQSAWLADYINLNTEMRKKAMNDFEKDFFKLMNNAIFGKTMQSKRKQMKMELVSSEKRLQKLINNTRFKHAIRYNENLTAVALENKIIKFDKPIYIGFAVLDISKTMMYDNVMKKHYNDNIELMYTDTGEEDAVRDKNDKDKVGDEKIKAKGIRQHVVKNHMALEEHKRRDEPEDEWPELDMNAEGRSCGARRRRTRLSSPTFGCHQDLDSLWSQFKIEDDSVLSSLVKLNATNDYDTGLPAEVRGLITASKAIADQVTLKGADLIDRSYIQNTFLGSQIPADDSGKSYSRLPEIPLPTFDGDLRDWVTIRNSFKSLLDKWPNLSDTDKIYYLVGFLKVDAAEAVRGIPLSGDNYHLVWSTLTDRFNRPRLVATSLVDNLLNATSMSQESFHDINQFLSTFNRNIALLDALKIKDLGSFMLFSIAFRCLPIVTRRLFEASNLTDYPTVRQLIDFIRSRVAILEVAGGSHKSTPSSAASSSKLGKPTGQSRTGGDRFEKAPGYRPTSLVTT